MPQSSNEWRDRYCRRFGDIGAEHAIRELKARGYTLTANWDWIMASGHVPTHEELFWIDFLAEEWDFGGLVGKGGSR